jgi:transcriptional regulator with XRE-family HTH domain
MSLFSERLKLAMDIMGMKQVDLVEKTGINKGALSCYLSGKYAPKQDNTHLLAKALNVDEGWLMGKDVPMIRKARNEQSETESVSRVLPEKIKELEDLLLSAKEEEVDRVFEIAKIVVGKQ